MLLKRGGSHNFLCLSIAVKSNTELTPLGSLPGLSCLDPWKLMPDPHSPDPDCCGNERVGREMGQQAPTAPGEGRQGGVLTHPNRSQVPITYNHRAKFLRPRAVGGMRQYSKNWLKTTNRKFWYLIFTLTIFIYPWLLMRSVSTYWPFGYSLLWYAGLSLVPIFLLVSVFVLTWSSFFLHARPCLVPC